MSNVVDRLRGVKSSQAIKVPCRVATTANITLSGEQTIDGVAVVDGDRVLVKNQTTASENGIYECDTGSWDRTPDWDGVGDVVTGTTVFVTSGNAGLLWYSVQTSGTIVVGTTSVTIQPSVGSGDIVGPASSTDGIVPRFDGTTGNLLQTSGITISDSDLLTINPSDGLVDLAAWTQTIGLRLQVELPEDGTSTPGSANEFGFGIQVVMPVTGATASYEKCAALFIAATSDPSTYGPDITKDAVALDMRGYILADNASGRAWGGYSEGRIVSGGTGDGLLYAHEFFVVNNGTDQSLVDTTTSKYGLHIVAGGANDSTAGIKFSGSGAEFHTGIYFSPDAIVTHVMHSSAAFSLRITGEMGFGTDTPDRLVHAEVADAGTTSVVYGARLSHVTSGTAAVGFGIGMEYELENASGNNKVAGRQNTHWLTATDSSEEAQWQMELMHAGTLTSVATIDSFGLITATGAFAVGANQVLGARKTGWTLPTGTAQRSGYTTYTSPNISAAYVEAEVQAIADGLEDVSRTLMALLEDSHQTAGHGFIGT